MIVHRKKQLHTILRATNAALDQKHLLTPWKEIDPKSLLIVLYWALCLKCDGSLFTYHDGSYIGLEGECPDEFQLGQAMRHIRKTNLPLLYDTVDWPSLIIPQEVGLSEGGMKPIDEEHGHTYTESGRIHCE